MRLDLGSDEARDLAPQFFVLGARIRVAAHRPEPLHPEHAN